MEELRKPMSNRLPFWNLLTDREKEILKDNTIERTYTKGSIVFDNSSSCLGLLNVILGQVRAYLVSDEGKEVTIFKLEDNDLCVLSASCIIKQITFDTQLVANEDTKVLIVPSNIIEDLAYMNIELRCYLYEKALARFSDVMWNMQELLFKGLDSRVANYLINQYERTDSTIIKVTHEEIANDINSAREAVTRILKLFVQDGLIKLQKGCIEIIDVDALYDI